MHTHCNRAQPPHARRPPVTTSWAMEDTLVPWVHYIPVAQDFSDLELKATWCLDNADACEEIGLNGRCYMQQFVDEANEAALERGVLERVTEVLQEAGGGPCAANLQC